MIYKEEGREQAPGTSSNQPSHAMVLKPDPERRGIINYVLTRHIIIRQAH